MRPDLEIKQSSAVYGSYTSLPDYLDNYTFNDLHLEALKDKSTFEIVQELNARNCKMISLDFSSKIIPNRTYYKLAEALKYCPSIIVVEFKVDYYQKETVTLSINVHDQDKHLESVNRYIKSALFLEKLKDNEHLTSIIFPMYHRFKPNKPNKAVLDLLSSNPNLISFATKECEGLKLKLQKNKEAFLNRCNRYFEETDTDYVTLKPENIAEIKQFLRQINYHLSTYEYADNFINDQKIVAGISITQFVKFSEDVEATKWKAVKDQFNEQFIKELKELRDKFENCLKDCNFNERDTTFEPTTKYPKHYAADGAPVNLLISLTTSTLGIIALATASYISLSTTIITLWPIATLATSILFTYDLYIAALRRGEETPVMVPILAGVCFLGSFSFISLISLGMLITEGLIYFNNPYFAASILATTLMLAVSSYSHINKIKEEPYIQNIAEATKDYLSVSNHTDTLLLRGAKLIFKETSELLGLSAFFATILTPVAVLSLAQAPFLITYHDKYTFDEVKATFNYCIDSFAEKASSCFRSRVEESREIENIPTV